MGAAAVAAHGLRSSLASSSFSSSSGLQSGRAAPLTVSAPRPARPPARPRRPSRAAAPPHSGGAGWGSRAAARRLERPGRARAGCACDWPAILPGLAREGSRRDEARWTTARRPPRSRPPGLRLGSPPHGSPGRPERRALLGRASLSGGDSPSVLCTRSAGVWRRPDLLTTQTHSTLQARAEPIAMASAVTAPEALPLLDERSFAGSQPSFLSKGCPHCVIESRYCLHEKGFEQKRVRGGQIFQRALQVSLNKTQASDRPLRF